jgi:putative oxidoreductase
VIPAAAESESLIQSLTTGARSDFITTHPMKYAPAIAGVVLGLLFIMSAVVVLFNLVKAPPIPEGTPAAMFMGAFAPTGYLTMVKVFELLGGILVAFPKTRNWGLLVLGPIILNILAYHQFIMNGEGLLNPMIILIVVLALYLLWVARRQFAGLLNPPRATAVGA